MKIQTFICLCTLLFFLSCEDHSNKDFEHTTAMKSVVVKSDTYFHYSNWYAFENKVFDADLNISTLKAMVIFPLEPMTLIRTTII